MKIPHPIPYQGSKRLLAAQILQYFPPQYERVLEPFAGSAAISLAVASHRPSTQIVLGDINAPLMKLWEHILHHASSLADAYENLWGSQIGQEADYYYWVRTQFNQTPRADYLLYLLLRCVKASVRYNAQGEFNQSPDHRRKGTHPETIRKQLLASAELLALRTQLIAADYRDVLGNAKTGDVIYLDPPYQGVSGKRDPRYMCSIHHEEFCDSLAALNQKNIAYLLSYDGRSGTKTYGQALPTQLGLKKVELQAGTSSQATLLGRQQKTVEFLYLSPAIYEQMGEEITTTSPLPLEPPSQQLSLGLVS